MSRGDRAPSTTRGPSSRARGLATRLVAAVTQVGLLAGCSFVSTEADRPPGAPDQQRRAVVDQAPERFTIVPDDYHVPYAGTAEDGRRFFLSEELFTPGGPSYVGLFLWHADGTFDEVRVDEVPRPTDLPPGQAGPAGAAALVDARLAELGDYVLEPIEVAPFTATVDGVRFGWQVGRYDDGEYHIDIMPGDFICYYEPWDGLEYDT